MCPSRTPDGEQRGFIVPIGGAEDKSGNGRILARFVALAGGAQADIVVVPTASRLPDTGNRYEGIFRELGAGAVKAMDIEVREDGASPEYLERLKTATGIFFTGGNQVRIATILGGTPVAKAIRAANARGVAVGGTSAGAAILSEHMIAGGDEGGSPRAGAVRMAPGLGLTNRFVIDQHFRERDRLGRLATAIAYNPFAVGLGLDEDTAAFIGPDNVLEVEGAGAVTVVDASNLKFSSMAQVEEGEAVCLLGLTVHMLTAGATFDLHTRVASAGSLAASRT